MAQEADEINIADFDMVKFLEIESDDEIEDEPMSMKRRRRNEICEKVNEIGHIQIKKRLSYEATTSVVKLMNGMPNVGITLPVQKKALKALMYRDIEFKILFNCVKCDEIFESETKSSKCLKCGHIFERDSKKNNFLIHIPLEPQIRRLLDKYFKDIVTYLNREHSNEFMSDVDDGLLFRKLSEKQPNVQYLTFTLNTDGANIFKSSKDSLWPIQLYANFLPPSIRYLSENIIISTIYYGRKKPKMMNLMYTLAMEFDILKRELISFYREDIFYNFCPVVLLCVFDLPARADVQAMKGPVGKFGCPYCLHPGIPIENLSGRTTIRHIHMSPQKLRSHNETVTLAKRISTNDEDNFGIKGHSTMMLFDTIDIIDSFPVDYMHNVLLGVAKDLIEIWLGKRKIPQPPYKEYMLKPASRQILENRILALKPYSDFSRKPRSINEIGSYKATELLNCLFYYLRYSLVGILPTPIIKHFEKLSAGIYILCKRNIKYEEIQTASNLLIEFAKEFDEIYGKGAVTMNVHLLIHYNSVVKQCGPLWSYSMFGFENNIGQIKNFVCGQTDVLLQVAEKYVSLLSEDQNEVKKDKKYVVKLKRKTKIAIEPEFSSILNSCEDISFEQGSSSLEIWRSIELKNNLYTSINAIATKSIDYFVKVNNGDMGTIQFFFGQESSPKFLLHVYRNTFENFHWTEVEQSDAYKIYPVEQIEEKLLFFKVGSIQYVTREPNVYGRGKC